MHDTVTPDPFANAVKVTLDFGLPSLPDTLRMVGSSASTTTILPTEVLTVSVT